MTEDLDNSNKQKRGASTLTYPYTDLETSVEVARAVHELGDKCKPEQLSAKLNMAMKGGAFRLRMLSCKTFGLIEYTRSMPITLTGVGKRIIDTNTSAQAAVDAFLSVDLFNRLYEEYKGATLPPSNGLENRIKSFGLSGGVVTQTRQVFQRSAKFAGFYNTSSDRLVQPVINNTELEQSNQLGNESAQQSNASKQEINEPLHPFIDGLLKQLPEPSSDWSMAERETWFIGANAIFKMLYKDSTGDNIEIKLIKSSIKE